MSARNVKADVPGRPEAVRLREALHANTRVTAATDPLKLQSERLDNRLRHMRARSGSLVEAIE